MQLSTGAVIQKSPANWCTGWSLQNETFKKKEGWVSWKCRILRTHLNPDLCDKKRIILCSRNSRLSSWGPWGHGHCCLGCCHDTKSCVLLCWYFLSDFWHQANSQTPSPSPKASPSSRVTGRVRFSVSGSRRQRAAPMIDSPPRTSSGIALEYVACGQRQMLNLLTLTSYLLW